MGNGIDYVYTCASGRSPKIVLSKTIRVWSLPEALQIVFNPGEAPVKNVVLGLRANGGSMTYQTIEFEGLQANTDYTIYLPTSAWMDAENMGSYPIVLSSIQFNMNTSTTGKQYHMLFKSFDGVYKVPVEAIPGDVNGDGVVNVSDVTSLINVILGNEPGELAICDINADGELNVSDVTALINSILD